MRTKKRIFVSVDIEGITGVIEWNDVFKDSKGDYDYFRKIMTDEANAAVEAAYESGATEVFVRDAHGSALNIIPSDLHKDAQLIRQWADSPYCMMEGFDGSFDAAILIGYHAKAGTPNATLKHTFSSKINDMRINKLSLAEASMNALIAGQFDVPVIFLSGDKAICDYISKFIPNIETVAVKEGMGRACINLHPDKSKELIKTGVKSAMKKIKSIKPFKLDPPFDFQILYAHENSANKAQWYPGAKRIDDLTVGIKTGDFNDCLRFLFFCEG
jgi:D-amino peptidase